MTDIIKKIKQFRFSMAIQSLVSVNEKMGIPLFVDKNILFVPFYQTIGDKCTLTSLMYVLYPEMRVVKFEKIFDKYRFALSSQSMIEFKETAIGCEFVYDLSQVPAPLKEIYSKAKEYKR